MKTILEESLIKQHKSNLARTRKIIIFLIDSLELVISEKNFGKESPEDWKYIWGEKENAVSVLTKLTGLLVKIVPMEQELENTKSSENDIPKGGVLTDEDKAIIRRYVERQSNN